MNQILYQIFNINSTFQIKTEYYLKLSTSDKKKLLETTKNKITKDKNGENGLI